jgi:hypothetical protein
LIDRFGLKVLAITFTLAVPVVALTGMPGMPESVLLAMAFFSGCVVVGMQNGLNAGAGLIYPTALRANGIGYALGVGRIGSTGSRASPQIRRCRPRHHTSPARVTGHSPVEAPNLFIYAVAADRAPAYELRRSMGSGAI